MAEKQVVFRLEEELHRRLQMYAMQKNGTVKEVMEDVVKQLLRGGQGIRPRMLKIIYQKFREQGEEIKDVLRKGFVDSLRLTPADKGTVIQVIINEYGEVRILETQKGIVPMSVIDLKAYLLYEFECMTDIIAYCNNSLDQDDMVKPLKGKYKDFIKWLIKHGIKEDFEYENEEDDDYEEAVHEIYTEYFFKDNNENHNEYLNFIYRWNLAIYLEIINFIRESHLGWYVEEEVEKAWDEIICREELELNFE